MGIRDYIIKNFENETIEGIKDAIDESIKENDEVTLPGLGVFFEMIWKNSNNTEQEKIIDYIYKSIKKGN